MGNVKLWKKEQQRCDKEENIEMKVKSVRRRPGTYTILSLIERVRYKDLLFQVKTVYIICITYIQSQYAVSSTAQLKNHCPGRKREKETRIIRYGTQNEEKKT